MRINGVKVAPMIVVKNKQSRRVLTVPCTGCLVDYRTLWELATSHFRCKLQRANMSMCMIDCAFLRI